MFAALKRIVFGKGRRKAPLLAVFPIPSALAKEIDERFEVFRIPGDYILFREGTEPEKLFFLRKGEVTLTVKLPFRTVACMRLASGALLDLSAVIGHRAHAMTGTVSEDAEVRHLGVREFVVLIESRPDLYLQALELLAAETQGAYQALAEMLSRKRLLWSPRE
ncbi:MAG: cyclic nucleotide-binding domain-containing protein [Terracidiphilus sp.]